MMSETFERAQLLAADLAGARIDANEAQKALAYVRSQQQGRALFTYLEAINNNGRAVIRSNQTLSYYRDLLAACERHLRPLQDDFESLLQTFAWSLRLVRYYKVVPDAVPSYDAQQRSAVIAPTASPEPAKPTRPQLYTVGDIFTGPIADADESAVLVEVPGFAVEKVTGVIAQEQLAGRTYRVGNTARVEVLAVRTLKSGRVILELKPAPRKKD